MKRSNFKRRLLWMVVSLLMVNAVSAQQWNPDHAISAVNAKYTFNYNQVPDNLVELYPPVLGTGTALYYQWEQSATPLNGFTAIPGATQSGYSFSTPLAQTAYFRRKTTDAMGNSIYSNTLKIEVVSVNWENLNYVREHTILKPGVSDWKVIDNLPVGDKLQTTTYLDGIGRTLQKVGREMATPAAGNNLWGDVVQFNVYDAYGRQPQQYLPYTTTTESGRFKSTPLTEQAQYNTSAYNETSAFSTLTYDNSPLNRVLNTRSPGAAWAAAAGNSVNYDLNEDADQVRMLTIGYTADAVPVNTGYYPANSLFKIKSTDENGKQVIEYIDKSGRLILKKVQSDDVPQANAQGWICTYSVYDDFGRLRYRIQPEAVKYLEGIGWIFNGVDGPQVLNELCYRYDYDNKGRVVYKKAPGAAPLQMLYDDRDRAVLMQDGNQRLKPVPEWTANLYDELDRPIISTLYRTPKTVSELQTDINNAVTLSTVTVSNPGGPLIDLVLNHRVPGIQYRARRGIVFIFDANGNFESAPNDEFTAEIDSSAVSPTIAVTTATWHNFLTDAQLNDAAVTTVLKYHFYDDYNFPGAQSFDTHFDNTAVYSNGDPTVIPIIASTRTLSFPTGSKVRVLGSNTFLTSTTYYDEQGRPIQTQEENLKSGGDVTTMQYHFDGRLLSTHSKHSTGGTAYHDFGILTKHVFDKIGRITGILKKYGSNDFKAVAGYDYDDIGRLKTKHLAPGYTGSGKNEMESLAYSYNIHSTLTGINKDYALKTPGVYNKWDHFFGLYLGYDNRDGMFNAAQLNGQVSGQLWNTQGDDAQRKYDYTYDNAGRLSTALFQEKATPGDVWSNNKMDFSVTGNGGKINYDLNGNLLSMLQKGVVPGTSAPVMIDNLQYAYASYSNKLQKVTDNSNAGAANGKLGDFKTNSSNTTDYVYDANGNLVIDLNKNIKDLGGVAGNGIRYNYLDKPEQIRISGKGLIQIVYDADGNRLQKTYTPEGSSNSKVTTYINQYVYEGDALQYINFEEGRIRLIQPVAQDNGYDALAINGSMDMPDGRRGVVDYYIRDYQQNVRMILTEETHFSSGTATMEVGRAGVEDPVFGQSGAGNEVAQTRFAVSNIPGQQTGQGWQNSSIGGSVSRLSRLTGKIGPNSLLKVMAGDELSTTAQYYYQNPAVNQTGASPLTEVLQSLLQAIMGSSATNSITKASGANITSQLSGNGLLPTKVAPDANATDNIPKAYLTVLFFDERFNYVGEGSASARVSSAGNSNANLTLAGIKAPKNGYAYIYVSNESDEPVYFDNLRVSHNRGRIVEEDHYYAFGLKIAGISSRKLADVNEGNVDNKYLYNDKELFDDGDLNWEDYGFRNYDPQIGRFVQIDPLTDETPALSGYHYALNDPITNIDEDGLLGIPCPGTSGLDMIFAKAGEVITQAAGSISSIALSATTTGLRLGTDYIIRQQESRQIGSQVGEKLSNNFVKFTKTAVDLDGGRDTYRKDDEGTDFINPNGKRGGILKIKHKWQTQKNDPNKYLSATAVVKNKTIPENQNDPDRYYDPETDPYVALNYDLKHKLGVGKGDKVLIKYKNATIEAVVGDAHDPDNPDAQKSTLEMSPAAFRALGIDLDFEVPARKNPYNNNKPYKNPKYVGSPDVELEVRKKYPKK